MEKKLLLSIAAVATTLAIGAFVFASNDSGVFKTLSTEPEGPIHPGSVTIDASNPLIDPTEYQVTVQSAAGNNFTFDFQGVTKQDGCFVLSPGSFIANQTALNGITSFTFTTPENDQEITIEFGIQNAYEHNIETSISSGGDSYDFNEIHPSYFRFYGVKKDSFSFSRLVINYSCVVFVPEYTITRLQNSRIGSYSTNDDNYIFAETDSNLADVSLLYSNVSVQGGKYLYFDDYTLGRMTNFSIKYADPNITTVQEGASSVSISFMLDGGHYTCNTVSLLGYSSYTVKVNYIYLHMNEFEIQNNDDMPEDFKLAANTDITLRDSSDDSIRVVNAHISNITITNQMINNIDEHPFSVRGQHSVNITYSNVTSNLNYKVYDTDYCNIRDIYFNEPIEVVAGTSNEDVLTMILNAENRINYYKPGKELPESATLTAENIIMTANMFANPGRVDVGIHYGTYEGTFEVRVRLNKGELVKTYTNEEGIMQYGAKLIGLLIYDNDVCEMLYESNPNYTSDAFAFTKVNNVITMNVEGNDVKFTVNDSNNTFTKYVRPGNVLYNLTADFSAFEAPMDFSAKLYDDNVIVFDIMGLDYECTFTYDPNYNNIIYFTFVMQEPTACKGTINIGTLTIVVTEAN